MITFGRVAAGKAKQIVVQRVKEASVKVEGKIVGKTEYGYNEDDFAQNAEDYIANSGQYDEEGNRLVHNTESNGRFHTDWLNMMYPRLKLAQRLLSPDGLIAISINEHEIAQLKMLMDEVFGAENFINNIVVETGLAVGVYTGYSNKRLPNVKSYLLVYAKDKTQNFNFSVLFHNSK